MSADKSEAQRLADALRALHDSKQPHPTGPHGQMMGEESWRIVASGNQLYALMEAHDLLRRWPDGEPVALVADVYQSRYTLEWNGRSMPEGTPLFAAPPAESERIAALEAALKQAGEALDAAKNGLQWYRDRYPNVVNASDAEADEQIDAALRAIEEVRK